MLFDMLICLSWFCKFSEWSHLTFDLWELFSYFPSVFSCGVRNSNVQACAPKCLLWLAGDRQESVGRSHHIFVKKCIKTTLPRWTHHSSRIQDYYEESYHQGTLFTQQLYTRLESWFSVVTHWYLVVSLELVLHYILIPAVSHVLTTLPSVLPDMSSTTDICLTP